MPFEFKLFFNLLYKSIFKSEESGGSLTPKRISVILIFIPTYITLEIQHRIAFLLDEIFFKDYKKVEVQKPLFIIGYPRSGTTYMQRLLSEDKEQFTYMRFWEIFLAPSIIQKKLFLGLGKIDEQLGSPLYKFIRKIEPKFFGSANKFHPFSFFDGEEDDMILLHIFSSIFISAIFPFEDVLEELGLFDLKLPENKRKRIMKFYKKCLQKHLYVFGKDKYYLSKNPGFTTKIRSLYETFPDAKIVYMIRNPLEAIPSAISFISYTFNLFNSLKKFYQTERVMKWTPIGYKYPLGELEKAKKDQSAIIKYDDLITDPKNVILKLYNKLGLKISEQFNKVLEKESIKCKQYKSEHKYSLEEVGLTKEEILKEYKEIFDKFGFH